MKTPLCSITTLLTFVTLTFVPNSFTQETSPEYVVRVIYFVPKDRQSQQDIDTQLDLLMKDVQQSYAEVMENHGFGRKTFPLETDNDGKVVVHHVKGLAPDVHYHTEAFSKVEKEIRQWFDPTTNVYFVVLDVSTEDIDGAYCGQGGAYGSFGGMSVIPLGGCLNLAVSAHELGHTFGLAHDRLRNANRASSSYHTDGMVTSFCAAEWLDVHAYFNAGENVSNENTQIQMLPSIVSLPNSVRIRFQIADADGLHQAQVMLNGHLITCQKLKGQRDTYEFEWIPGLYGISDHLILRVIDVHGNFTDQYYPIDIAAMLPPPKVVSIPDTNLATAIREALNLAPGDPFTERNLLKLINLDAEDQQITDLTGLEHATQLQQLNLGGNQISDISPLASLEIVESLVLPDNQISDISVLTDLPALSNLDLGSNQIRDITPLAGLQLRGLWLRDNQISDLNGLTDLPVLIDLDLGNNQIRDITPLTGLKNLTWLNLSDNQISDLNGLTDLPVLRYLDLTSNQIRDITPLAGLTQLRGLWIWYNHIPDISPLAELSHLTHLHLENNVISDVSPLAGLINLERLALDDNLIFDISLLDGLTENTHISWSNNPGFPIGGPKITGPWLWVIVPETRLDDSTDFLARASGGETTELEVATNGAKEGTAVGDSVWTPHKLSDSGGDNINEMITALGWGTGEEIYDRIVYGSIVLDSPRAQNTQMFVGSDDGVKVWLNGELVHQSLFERGADDYKAFFPVTLKQGKNVLLVAVDNRGWWWSSGFFGFAPDAEYTVTPETPATTTNATVSVSPSPVPSPPVGEQLTLSLKITGGENVAGYQATVAFDTSALRYVSSANGDYLPAGAFFVPPVVDGPLVTLAATSLAGESNGDGTLATLTFEVIAVKASTVTLSEVVLSDSAGTGFRPHVENGEIVESPKLTGDINDDGVVNIQDLVIVAGQFGQSGQNSADVNKDGVVNIQDLVLVASAFGNTVAAPALRSQALSMLTATDVQGWLAQARGLALTDAASQRGIIFLEQLLSVLIPKKTALLPNYPNPFNPETWIPYRLAHAADVEITIYNTRGTVVRRLDVGHQSAGFYTARAKAGYWNGRNRHGESVASGVYFYQLRAGDYSALRRMVIVK